MRQGDHQTAAACLEQHLQLVQQLGDWQGEINAWAKMAELAATGIKAGAHGDDSGGSGVECDTGESEHVFLGHTTNYSLGEGLYRGGGGSVYLLNEGRKIITKKLLRFCNITT